MRGCLLIHGFTGSPYEIEPLARHIENLGYAVSTPTLAGHGASKEEMKMYTWQDWIQSAEHAYEAMKEQHNEIDVIGFSMGGMIAAHLARKYEVRRLIFLSAAAYYMNHSQMIKDLFLCLKKENESENAKHLIRRYVEKAKETPIKSVWNFRKLVRHLRPAFKDITVPALVVQGECDNLVTTKSAEFIYNELSSEWKELVYFPKSKHIICHDCEKELLFDKVSSFLEHDITDQVEEQDTEKEYAPFLAASDENHDGIGTNWYNGVKV